MGMMNKSINVIGEIPTVFYSILGHKRGKTRAETEVEYSGK